MCIYSDTKFWIKKLKAGRFDAILHLNLTAEEHRNCHQQLKFLVPRVSRNGRNQSTCRSSFYKTIPINDSLFEVATWRRDHQVDGVETDPPTSETSQCSLWTRRSNSPSPRSCRSGGSFCRARGTRVETRWTRSKLRCCWVPESHCCANSPDPGRARSTWRSGR